MAMPQVQYNERGIPVFTVGGPSVPDLQPGEAGAAEIPTPSGKMVEFVGPAMEGETFKPTGLPPVETPSGKMVEFMPDISPVQTGKPSLSLGQQFNQAMTPPPASVEMPAWKRAALTPFLPLEAGAQAATGMFANTVSTVADPVMEMFGRPKEERQQIQEKINQALTYKPVNPDAEWVNQVMSMPFGMALEKAGEIPGAGPLVKKTLEYVFAMAPGMPGVKGSMAKQPLGKTMPYTQQGLKAQQLAQEYNLPAYPSTLSKKPVLQGVVNRFNSQVAPMFEKIKTTIESKVAESNEAIKTNLDDVTSQFKNVDEQVKFLGEKGEGYSSIYDKLPKRMELPEFKTWLSKQISIIEKLAEKQQKGLTKDQFNLLSYYQNLMDKAKSGGFDPSDVANINGKNPMTPNVRTSARFKVREDLKSLGPIGETIGDQIMGMNKEYSLTSRSRVVTGFIEKVMDKDGFVDVNKWNRQYNNFKLNNITRMPKEVIAKFDEINRLVNERNQFKTEMETVFGKELKAYEDYQNKPSLGKIEGLVDKVIEWSVAGGAGGAMFGFPKAGLTSAALGGTALAVKQGGGILARNAVKPKGKPSLSLKRE